jgi:hypothetical protein
MGSHNRLMTMHIPLAIQSLVPRAHRRIFALEVHVHAHLQTSVMHYGDLNHSFYTHVQLLVFKCTASISDRVIIMMELH